MRFVRWLTALPLVAVMILLSSVAVATGVLALFDFGRLIGWSEVQNSIPASYTIALLVGRLLGGAAAFFGLFYLFLVIPRMRKREGQTTALPEGWDEQNPRWAMGLGAAALFLLFLPLWGNLSDRGQYVGHSGGYEYLGRRDESRAKIWRNELARQGVRVPSKQDDTADDEISSESRFWFWQLGVAEGYRPYRLAEANTDDGLPLVLSIAGLAGAREIARALLLLAMAYVLRVVFGTLQRLGAR